MTSRLIFSWPHWQESLTMYTKAELMKWLNSGFTPKDCKIFIEKDGQRHEWKGKPSLKGDRSPELEKLLLEQNADNLRWADYRMGCRDNKEKRQREETAL